MNLDADQILSLAWSQFWQVAALAIVAGLASLLFLRHRPHWAHALWLVVLVKCLTPPLWSSHAGVFSWASATTLTPPIAATSVEGELYAGHAPPLDELAFTTTGPEPIVGDDEADTAAGSASAWSWPAIAIAAWGVGVGLVIVVAAARTLLVHRQLRCVTSPAEDRLATIVAEVGQTLGIRSRVAPLIARGPWGPALIGLWRPRLVLPESLAAEWSDEGLRHIVAHELVHWRRGDSWIRLGQLAATAVWWFHPAVWWLNAELHRRREQCCDEEVVAGLSCGGANYAQTLIEILRHRRHLKSILLSPGVRVMQITASRLAHITSDERRFSRRTPAAAWIVAAACAAIVLPGAGLVIAEAPPMTESAKPAVSEKAEPASPALAMEFACAIVDATTNKPLADATVIVKRLSRGQNGGLSLVGTSEHLSSDRGTFTVTIPAAAAAEPSTFLVVSARHPKYVTKEFGGYGLSLIRQNLKFGESPFFTRLSLFPGEEIAGVVKRPDGKPAAGAVVHTVTTAKEGDPLLTGGYSEAETTADDTGRFRFNAFPGGQAMCWVEPTDTAPATQAFGTKRGDVGVLQLEAGVIISGQAVDAEGRPVANAWVRAVPNVPRWVFSAAEPRFERSVLTDAKGKFRLAPVPAGSYLMFVADERSGGSMGGERVAPLTAAFVPREIMVKNDDPAPTVELRAVPHVSIKARFLDGAGQPTRGHDVHLTSFGGKTPLTYIGRVRPSGEIDMKVPRGLADARLSISTDEHSVLRYRRSARGELNGGQEISLGTLDRDVDDIELIRVAAPKLVVKAIDETGQLLGKAQPRIDYAERNAQTETAFAMLDLKARWVSGVEGHVSLEHHRDGRWRTSQLLPDQKFTVTMTAPGRAPASSTMTLPAGATKELEMRLDKKP